jgi:uncharacterized protein YggT (Ycf19 family)
VLLPPPFIGQSAMQIKLQCQDLIMYSLLVLGILVVTRFLLPLLHKLIPTAMKTEFWKSILRIFERFIKPFTGLVNK